MDYKTKEITKYFRSAVAAQANMGIDFKVDTFYIIDPKEVVQGKINFTACKSIFAEAKKSTFDDENEAKKKSLVNVIICAKTIKTLFEANEKLQDEIDELTGVYYIPAILNAEGTLLFDEGDKKLPWFPREYLRPMVEPKLAIGDAEVVDNFMSNHVDRIEKIKSWSDYATFFKELYEVVTESEFEQNTIRNLDNKEPFFELERVSYQSIIIFAQRRRLMKNIQIGVRALDIHSGLYSYQDEIIDLKLRNTVIIGKAASLASHLRGVQVVEKFDGLIVLASKLGISAAELQPVLEILNDIEYVKIIGPKWNPTKIEVLISKFDTTFDRLGESWKSFSPAEFEQKAVTLTNDLTKSCMSVNEVSENYDVRENELDTMLQIGKQGGFLDEFENEKTKQNIIFSPIYMEENPKQVMTFLSNQDEKVVKKTLDLLENTPGYPVSELMNVQDDLVLELMNKNIVQTPAISASGGKVNFVFSPFTETHDKQMLKHARYVVAAVRYAQRFSNYSSLISPMTFLNHLLDYGYIGKKPHTDIKAQYDVLRDCGLGRIEEIYSNRYRFYLADTEYARNVVRLAKRILFQHTDFDPDAARGIIEEAWILRSGLSAQQFNSYIPNLGNLKNVKKALNEKKKINKKKDTQKDINNVLNKLFYREGEPDVF